MLRRTCPTISPCSPRVKNPGLSPVPLRGRNRTPSETNQMKIRISLEAAMHRKSWRSLDELACAAAGHSRAQVELPDERRKRGYLPAVLGDLCRSTKSAMMFNVSRRIASESAVFPFSSSMLSPGVGDAFASLPVAGKASFGKSFN
jgi:hypothetical protein